MNTPKERRRVFNTADALLKNMLSTTSTRPTKVFLSTKWDGYDLLKKHSLVDEFKHGPGVLARVPQYLYLSPQNKHLAPRFVNALNAMKRSG